MTITTPLSGASDLNEDGTTRQEFIRQSKVGDKVRLKPHPVDRYSVMVETLEGKGLGHLPPDAAGIIRDRLAKEKKGYLTGSVLEQQTEEGGPNLLIDIEPDRFPYWVLMAVAAFILLTLILLLL